VFDFFVKGWHNSDTNFEAAPPELSGGRFALEYNIGLTSALLKETTMTKARIFQRFSIFFLAVTLLLLITPGQAYALMVKLSLEDLTLEADSIITGTVVETESQWDTSGGNIYTTVKVAVVDNIKGNDEPDYISIIIPGGQVDGVTQIVSDTPHFEPGQEALLFLNQLPWYNLNLGSTVPRFFEMCGNFQGQLKIEGSQAGEFFKEELEEELNSFLEGETNSITLDLGADFEEYVSYAFTPLPFRWTGLSPEIPYYVNATSTRTSHVNAAATTWSSAGANFAFNYRGQHNRTGGPLLNNYNEILWRDLGTYNALAVATIWVSGSTIIEADMSFNTRYSWSTSGSYYDVQTVALHEFGHWVGLDHSSSYGSIMYYQYKGTQRHLGSDDLAGIRYIYGNAAPVIPCEITAPARPSGPANGSPGTNYNFTTSGASCSNGHALQYEYDFGDGNISSWRTSTGVTKYFSSAGTYQVKVRARCAEDNNKISAWSQPLTVTIGNPVSTYTLTVEVAGEGTTEPAAGTHQVTEGNEVALNAIPGEGWQFEKWLIGTVEFSDPTVTVTVSGNTTAKAFFVEPEEEQNNTEDEEGSGENSEVPAMHNLIVTIEGQGTTIPGAGTHQYETGEAVELSAVAADNWKFEKWLIGNLEYAESTLQVTMDSNLEVTAIFSDMPEIIIDPQPETDPAPPTPSQPAPAPTSPPPTQYALTVDSQGSGSTNPVSGMHQYAENTTVTLTAAPAEDWRFVKWVIDSKDINNPEIEVKMDTNYMATAFFAKLALGDITGDGKTTVQDITILTRHSLGLSQMSESQLVNADVNGDGVVDVRDIALLMQYALGLIDSFPAN